MRRFYIAYPKQQTVSVKLSWSHYCELLSIDNIDERLLLSKEYALGGLENNVFASTYTYYIPGKEILISEVEKVLKEL